MQRENAERYLGLLDEYLGRLIAFSNSTTEEILGDELKLHTVERMFQLTVDTAIDLNTFIIRAQKLSVPDDNFSTFTLMGEKQILPKDFSRQIAPTVGLRNAVVHRYEKMSTVKMINDIKLVIPLYQEYFKLMRTAIQKLFA